MRNLTGAAFLVLWISATSPSGFSQLRNLSEFSQDRINTDQTYFALQEKDAADFQWASEWTHMTANAYPEKMAMFLWHFKDGSKAYSRQGDLIGDAGQITGFLRTDQSATLEDVHRKKIQPLNRTNYPVTVELWIGDIADSSGFLPEVLMDRVCFNAKSIEYKQLYHFEPCQ